ncbi:nuclear transport factor 2 family protein [Pedobacter cryoconitis]|uniref:Ketosteroid isomerase-like protein n=1 Tax=Pedobacter cryoconitis TaxID=188932 RepID=A0A7X0J2B5_9SPHI|nr:nuclear transport factor 2 family protein [Pedobacter cryoconitis]MBB6499753.1 ketosteroid isomerase-like protein [Pedobacter cryoconitis]
METNESLIHHFYTCFKNKDIKGMQACYADDATFSDAVFKSLNANQVRKMWEMLIKKGKDMRIEYDHVEVGGEMGSAEWIAHYTFSLTGKKVVNKIKASFVFENGKIIQHEDDFSFYKWSKQALGLTGLLLGWTGFLRNKISETAFENLRLYMAAHPGP